MAEILSKHWARFAIYIGLVSVIIKFAVHVLLTDPHLTPANDELRMALARGFPTDNTPLQEVQQLVVLLRKTAETHPLYVMVVYCIGFLERRILPPFEFEPFLLIGFNWYFGPTGHNHYFLQSHEFYLNAMATPLMDGSAWHAFLLCAALSFTSLCLSYCLVRLMHWAQCRLEEAATAPYRDYIADLEDASESEDAEDGEQQQQSDEEDSDGNANLMMHSGREEDANEDETEDAGEDEEPSDDRPQAAVNAPLANAPNEAAHQPVHRQRFPNAMVHVPIYVLIFISVTILRSLPFTPSWLVNMVFFYMVYCPQAAPDVREAMDKLGAITFQSLMLLFSGLGGLPYTFYCVTRPIQSLDTPDTILNGWGNLLSVFACLLGFWLACSAAELCAAIRAIRARNAARE